MLRTISLSLTTGRVKIAFHEFCCKKTWRWLATEDHAKLAPGKWSHLAKVQNGLPPISFFVRTWQVATIVGLKEKDGWLNEERKLSRSCFLHFESERFFQSIVSFFPCRTWLLILIMAQPPPANPQANQSSPAHAVAPQAAGPAQPPAAAAVVSQAAAASQPPAAAAAAPQAAAVAQQPAAGAAAAQPIVLPAYVQAQPIRFALERAGSAAVSQGWPSSPTNDVRLVLAMEGGPYRLGGDPRAPQFATYRPILYDNHSMWTHTWPVHRLGGHRALPESGPPSTAHYLGAQALANAMLLPNGQIQSMSLPYMYFQNQNVFGVLSDQ